ncbi:MAG: dephospho-CoA kinase [Acidimicrobiaceae bacterium]|nr:dephospho-CoA kinase [Acidimicrobiaceae bacterium]
MAGLLARRGAVVIDADQVAREVTAPGGAAYQAMVDHFGPAVVGPDGVLDRATIAARVFSDQAELAALNAMTHPAIVAALLACLGEISDSGHPVVLEIPLLTSAMRTVFRLAGVVVVDAPVDVAIRRLVERRGLTAADAEARIRAQVSREERLGWADLVVDNSGSRESLVTAVAGVWEWLEQLAAGGSSVDGSSVDGASVDGPSQEAFDADRRESSQEQD